MADIKTPWLRLLWFLAPFPPAAPYAEILGETNAQQEDYILQKLLSGSGSKAYIILDRYTAIHLSKWLETSAITQTQSPVVRISSYKPAQCVDIG